MKFRLLLKGFLLNFEMKVVASILPVKNWCVIVISLSQRLPRGIPPQKIAVAPAPLELKEPTAEERVIVIV